MHAISIHYSLTQAHPYPGYSVLCSRLQTLLFFIHKKVKNSNDKEILFCYSRQPNRLQKMSERSTNPVTETETSNLKRENPIIIEESNSESKKQKTEAEVLTSKESKRNDSGTEEKKQKQQQIAAGKEFKIEANAAEDKGSRHSMEDAWVVLLDASLDSPPGKLRFFRVFFFIFCFWFCVK